MTSETLKKGQELTRQIEITTCTINSFKHHIETVSFLGDDVQLTTHVTKCRAYVSAKAYAEFIASQLRIEEKNLSILEESFKEL